MKKTLMLALLLAATGARADVAVVVAANSPLAGLNAEQVADVFLGKSTAATPVDQAEGAAPREEFYTKVAGKSSAQVKAYWSKLIFTGKGQPPKEVAGNADVKKAVAADPKAIGYIDKGAVDASVKVILSQ